MFKLSKFLFILCIIFLFKIIFLNFQKKDIFLIENIVINGKIVQTEKDIYNPLLKSLKGKNIWKVDRKILKKQLLKDVRIKDVIITKKIPDTLEIKIFEKKPYVYVLKNQKLYLTDEVGIIFAYRIEEKNLNLPILDINSDLELEKLLQILKKIQSQKFREKISQIQYKSENEIYIILNDGILIKTKMDTLENKYLVLEKLYDELKRKGKNVNYIDIRFQDYIVK